MKIAPVMNPAAAFPDATHQPADADLRMELGANSPLEKLLDSFRSAQPAVTTAWQFSPRSGWYQLLLLKKRRLLYLVPQHGNFRLMMLLGGKAIELLKQGSFARQTLRLLKTAKRYPEGTVFSFDRQTFDPALVGALLAAKIAF